MARVTRMGRLTKDDGEVCGTCGRLRHNVSHTPDADIPAELRDYYEHAVTDRHQFKPTGRYDPNYTEGLTK